MATIINAVSGTGLTQSADGSGVLKVQSNGVTTNALAWVNFNGTTSPGTIRSAYNVSSVTKVSTGIFEVNFTNVLIDANYAAVCSGSGYPANYAHVLEVQTTATTNVRVISNYSAALQDFTINNVAIFGN